MGGKASGRNIYLGIGKESSFGTKVAVTDFLKQTGFTGGLQKEYVESESRVGSRAKDGAFPVGESGQLAVPFEANPIDIGFFLKGFLGDEAVALVSATLAYTHTFTMGISLPSWTLERGYDAVKYLAAVGAVLNELSLEMAAKAIVTGNAAFLFKSESVETVGAPTYTDVRPFVFADASLEIDSVAFGEARTIKLSGSNGINADDYRLDGTGQLEGLDPNGFNLTGDMAVVFNTDSYSERTKFLNGTAAVLKITLDTGIVIEGTETFKLEITLHKVQYTGGDIGTEEDGMMMSLPFTCFDDGTNGIITAVLTNNRSTEH